MLLLDVTNNTLNKVNAKGLDDYYRLIDCRTVDIVSRTIGGKRYSVICDDEALFDEKPKVAALDKEFGAMLYGNLIITGPADGKGGMLPLEETDYNHLKNNVVFIAQAFSSEGEDIDFHLALTNMDY